MSDKKQKVWKNIWLALGVILIASLVLTGCGSTQETTDTQVYRVGILSGTDVYQATIDGFQAGMTEAGYFEGENIIYDLKKANGDSQKMNELASEFVADEVDLILTTTTSGVKAAQAATTDIPVIFTIVLNPVASGVVNTYSEPGENVTGVTRPVKGYLGKRVEFLHQMSSDVGNLWVPNNPNFFTTNTALEELVETAPLFNISLVDDEFTSSEEFLALLESYNQADTLPFEAIFMMPDPAIQTGTNWQAILSFAVEHNLPIVGNVSGQVEQGALFSYADDIFETGQLASQMGDKILKGADPATLPVVFSQPQLIVNQKAAQELGLEVDNSLLQQAVTVIR